jgi:hypothetical protein
MSIIDKPREMVKREYELQAPNALAIAKCATFIQSTRDHLVKSALKMVIWTGVQFRRGRSNSRRGQTGRMVTPR